MLFPASCDAGESIGARCRSGDCGVAVRERASCSRATICLPEGLHKRLEGAVRTPRARHRRIARGSHHARPDVGPQKPFHAAGADCGATQSLCHGVSGLTRARHVTIRGCRDGADSTRAAHRKVPSRASERTSHERVNAPLRSAVPRSEDRGGDTESQTHFRFLKENKQTY